MSDQDTMSTLSFELRAKQDGLLIPEDILKALEHASEGRPNAVKPDLLGNYLNRLIRQRQEGVCERLDEQWKQRCLVLMGDKDKLQAELAASQQRVRAAEAAALEQAAQRVRATALQNYTGGTDTPDDYARRCLESAAEWIQELVSPEAASALESCVAAAKLEELRSLDEWVRANPHRTIWQEMDRRRMELASRAEASRKPQEQEL
jgi:hypothetical protein